MTRGKSLLLVDGSSFLYRAFYAMPSLTNSAGEPTGAIYGVVNMVRKLLADHDPGYVAIIFDAKGKTFRDDLYEQYKARRLRMPDELSAQSEPLRAIIHAMGLPLLVVEGVEADDVIGTLATQANAIDLPTFIATGDKDLAQLVSGRVKLINTNNTVLDTQGVIEKFGIPPGLIIDYLALVGDSVDNIPGVPKVGPTTAAKWLKQYGSLDGIVEHSHEISGKVGESLRAALPQLPLSRQLLTVKCDVVLPVSPLDLAPCAPDNASLRTWFTRLEFKTWLAQVDARAVTTDTNHHPIPSTVTADSSEPVYHIITTEQELEEWLERLAKAELFCFDLVTAGQDYMRAEVVGLTIALEPGAAAYLPLAHDYTGAPIQLERTKALERLCPLFENAKLGKLGHDLKFAVHVLANHGIRLTGLRFDTMLESYVWDSTAARHDLDSLARHYLAERVHTLESIAGKGAKQLSFNQIAIDHAARYAAEGAELILRLHQVLWPKLAGVESLQRLFEDIELPLARVLVDVERNGVSIDATLLQRQSTQLAERMRELELEAYAAAGQPFNLGSPLQIQEILYDKLGLPVLQKTPKGQPSTAEATLQELALDYPLPRLILKHRGLSKLKSTYTDTLPGQINSRTGRVHTCYRQAIAATGRLSSSDPNLQNIPIRSSEGRRIRQAFIAAPGYKIVAADYSQIELRIMAHLSGDAQLLRAFAAAEDVHKITAAEVFGVPLDHVTHEQRRAAKTINFGLIYGMSSFGLARQLGVTRSSAQDYLGRYFLRYPGVKTFMDTLRAQAHRVGYVETVFGRRLYLPSINDRNVQRRQYAERTAINAPMQGSAADIIKLAMLRVDDELSKGAVDAKMIMQVHDELVFEVAAVDLDAAVELIRRCMIEVAGLSVPLLVEVGVGNNWDEAH